MRNGRKLSRRSPVQLVAIIHLHSCTTICHQVGNSSSIVGSRITVFHISPIKTRLAGNNFVNMNLTISSPVGITVVCRNVGLQFIYVIVCHGYTMMIDHLCHCRCHTTRHTSVAIEKFGTCIIVG